MDFLKDILGEDLFNQVSSKINEHNGNEANKDKQLKLANLASGEYVGKGKHDALQSLLDGQKTELEQANNLIAELKKGTKGNEDLQNKVSTYETQMADLQKQLAETKIKAALKVALLSEKALDIDYLTFKVNEKLQEQGKSLELDENDNIKGWDDMLSGLKTQFPAQFESNSGNGKGMIIEPNKLPQSEKRDGMTKADLLRKPYAERMQFYNENPEAYKNLMNS